MPLGADDQSARRAGSGREHAAVDLLNINEVAATLRVSKMTVYRFIRAGRLPAIRVGNSLRVHRSDLGTFLKTAFRDGSGGNPDRKDSAAPSDE